MKLFRFAAAICDHNFELRQCSYLIRVPAARGRAERMQACTAPRNSSGHSPPPPPPPAGASLIASSSLRMSEGFDPATGSFLSRSAVLSCGTVIFASCPKPTEPSSAEIVSEPSPSASAPAARSSSSSSISVPSSRLAP